jgi:hypothetical protein
MRVVYISRQHCHVELQYPVEGLSLRLNPKVDASDGGQALGRKFPHRYISKYLIGQALMPGPPARIH